MNPGDCHTSDIGHWFAMTAFLYILCFMRQRLFSVFFRGRPCLLPPSLRGDVPQGQGGVSFVLTTLPPSRLSPCHLPQRGRQGVVPILWEIATATFGHLAMTDSFVGATSGRPLGPLFEGAGCEVDWGSVVCYEGHSLRHGFRRATSLREGGKGMYYPSVGRLPHQCAHWFAMTVVIVGGGPSPQKTRKFSSHYTRRELLTICDGLYRRKLLG